MLVHLKTTFEWTEMVSEVISPGFEGVFKGVSVFGDRK